jgi:Fe2+ transport system protein FeoA
MNHDFFPLQMLSVGQRAEVVELFGAPADVVRLQELGLRTGQTVEMVQAGSPCIVRLDGHKLCFRDSDCFGVLVRLGDAP